MIDAIAIGGSAGGVSALATLLPALSASYRGAVFIVVHLPRERRSLLASILAPWCALPVCEADDKVPVEPGTVYVAPADYHMLIDVLDDGPQLALSADEPVHYSRPAIDVFFEAAADVYGSRLLGIILTGASEDGAAGLAAVARAGGRAAVQDPDTAEVPVMPAAALRLVSDAQVRPLDGLAALLTEVTNHE